MADVSKTQTRMQRSDRPVGRRASILPQRRNQEQVRTQNFGDMRSARIGDVGGAEALMRISQQVLGAGRDFQRLDQARYEQQAQEDAAEGALDASNGEIDEARAAESEAYNQSARMGQVRQRLAGILPKVEGAVAEAVAAGEGKTLEEREALINNAVNAEFEGVLIDEEGSVLDFGTAQANVYAGNKLMTVRAQVSEDGYRKARLQMDDESIDNAANAVAEAVLDGEEVTPELFEAHLTATADPDLARTRAFRVLENLAVSDPERAAPALEKLLEDIEAGNGSDFFDAEDQVTILGLSEKADNALELAREKVRKERYELNAEELFELQNAGQLTEQEVLARAGDDRISQRFARTMVNSIQAERRQQEAEARARRSEARAIRMENLARMEAARDREFGWELIRAKTGITERDPVMGLGEIAKSYEDRGMNLSPSQLNQLYGALQTGAEMRRSEPKYVQYSSQLNDQFNADSVGGYEPTPEQKFRHVQALDIYDGHVIGGKSPVDAYRLTLKEMGASDSSAASAESAELAELEARRPKD